MIKIKFDERKIADEKVVELANALMKIVQDATGIPEVFVFADSPRISINAVPLEVFIKMSASKVQDRDELFEEIKLKLTEWKKDDNFDYPVTLTLIPVDWKFDVGI